MSFYFDNAATTFPKPECVYSFMDAFYRKNGGNAGRGQYKLAGDAQRIVFETREFLKELLDCSNKDVLFTPNATIALNMVIQGVISFGTKVKTVYISPFEHNSVTRVLRHFEKSGLINLRILSVSKDLVYELDKIQQQFKEENPDFVIVSHASNVIGLIAPIFEIFSEAKRYKATTLTDMAQTAALVPLNVGSSLIDFAVFEGHKTLYGPFGAAGFVKSKDVYLEPILFGGTGIESANQEMPESLPSRYEAGSQNVAAIAGLHASCKWFLENQKEIRIREEQNHRRLLALLQHYEFIRIVGPGSRFGNSTKCIGVVSTLFENYSPEDIGNVLDEMEIAVRTGLHCSPFAHRFLGTFPSGTVRFSVGYFTGDEAFGALEKALEYIKENG